EARAREELRAAQARLAETTRLGERVRISRELHDALGHHLTALRLNLEAASRTADGRAREPVQAAQSIAQMLLTEVRAAVEELRARDDGRGADEVRAGNGLRGLRERVEGAGGALTVETRPGAGFSVRATLPLPGAVS